jgi:hypothetical protein
MSFHKMIEDPMYDEDGNCVDEDWDIEFEEDILEEELVDELGYDPFDTINS